MNKYTFTHNGTEFTRVNKTKARNLFQGGKTILFCPCNMRPFSAWGSYYKANKTEAEYTTFDKLCDEVEFYTCKYKENGKYLAFYVEG